MMKTPNSISEPPITHARIFSVSDTSRCLDAVQLERLEHSFRIWVEGSSRQYLRVSRRRVLLIFLLIRYTGARLNEVLNVNPCKDIDYGNHTVRLRKGRSQNDPGCREVQIPERLSVDIARTIADPRFESSATSLFKIDPAHIRRKFYERARACGMPPELGAPEVIRRSRAVELMQSNMPLPVVQRILGHSTPNLTASYVKFSDDEMRMVARFFAERENQRKTSARNAFFGKIAKIHRGDIQARVEVASVGGYRISALITHESLTRLGLKPGTLVVVEVKAPWVQLYKGDKEPLSSAENRFQGKVGRIIKGKITAEIVVRIGDGTELCSVISEESRQAMGIEENDTLWVTFNAFAVVLHVE